MNEGAVCLPLIPPSPSLHWSYLPSLFPFLLSLSLLACTQSMSRWLCACADRGCVEMGNHDNSSLKLDRQWQTRCRACFVQFFFCVEEDSQISCSSHIPAQIYMNTVHAPHLSASVCVQFNKELVMLAVSSWHLFIWQMNEKASRFSE